MQAAYLAFSARWKGNRRARRGGKVCPHDQVIVFACILPKGKVCHLARLANFNRLILLADFRWQSLRSDPERRLRPVRWAVSSLKVRGFDDAPSAKSLSPLSDPTVAPFATA